LHGSIEFDNAQLSLKQNSFNSFALNGVKLKQFDVVVSRDAQNVTIFRGFAHCI
jgi:hypothetical protein